MVRAGLHGMIVFRPFGKGNAIQHTKRDEYLNSAKGRRAPQARLAHAHGMPQIFDGEIAALQRPGSHLLSNRATGMGLAESCLIERSHDLLCA